MRFTAVLVSTLALAAIGFAVAALTVLHADGKRVLFLLLPLSGAILGSLLGGLAASFRTKLVFIPAWVLGGFFGFILAFVTTKVGVEGVDGERGQLTVGVLNFPLYQDTGIYELMEQKMYVWGWSLLAVYIFTGMTLATILCIVAQRLSATPTVGT
jgi:hypothetical protein